MTDEWGEAITDEILTDDFKFEEIQNQPVVFTVVGPKNSGKTSLTYMLKGKKVYLSYDKKSKRPKDSSPLFKDSEDIFVLPAGKFYLDAKGTKLSQMSQTKKGELFAEMQKTSIKTYKYTMWLMEQLRENMDLDKEFTVDYLIHDGSEIVWKICEQMMRYYNKLGPSEGVKNMNLWKERNMFWDSIYQTSIFTVKPSKAQIFTTYYTVKEVIDGGQVMDRKDVPAWYGNMMYETDVTFHTFVEVTKEGKKTYKVRIDSKMEAFPDGAVLDVTSRDNLMDVIKEWKKENGK